MKLFISVLLSVFALLIVGALVGPNFVDWNQYKAEGQAQVKKFTGYDLVMGGDVRVSVFPSPHLIVQDAQLKAPTKSRVEDLIKIKSLEVYVSLVPLLKGNVEVSAVNLIEPDIALEVAADGTPNWLTAEVKTLQNAGGKKAPAGAASAKSSDGGINVSFDRVRVKDARFQYYNAKGKSLQLVEDINLDLSAASLQGPFALDGDVKLNGMDIDFQASVKELDMAAKNLPLKLSADIDKNTKFEFSGVVDYGDNPGAQGESTLTIDGLRALTGNNDLPNNLNMKGFVTADAKAISYKNLELKVDDDVLKGVLSIGLSPVLVKADLKAVSGLNLEPLVPVFDNFGLRLNAAMAGKSIEFKNTHVDFDGQSVLLEGGYVPAASADKRARANILLVADALNLDKIMAKLPQKKKASTGGAGDNLGASGVQDAAKAFALPLDVAVKGDVKSLTYNGQVIQGVKVNGAASGNGLSVKALSVQNYAGAAISVNGDIKNLSDLSGITANIALNTKNPKGFAKSFGVDVKSFPKGLKSLALKSVVQGDLDNLGFTANANAMGGSVIAKGKALNVADNLALSDLVLQVKHPNMSKAIQSFAGGKSYPTLAKPLNFYAKLENKGKLYSFNNMSVDLAGTPLKGALAVDLGGKVPKLSGDLKLGDFTMMSAAGKAAQSRAAAGRDAVSAPRSAAARWSSDLIDSGFLHAMNLDLALAATSLRFDNWALNKPSLKIVMQDGTLDIQNLNANMYGGTMNIDATIKADNKPKAPLAISAKAKLRDVAIEQLTTSLAAGSKLVQGKGRVSLDSDIKTVGSSQRAMVNALSGTGQVSGSNIVLEGFDLTRFVRAMDVNGKPGDTLLGLWKGTTKGGSTTFETLTGAYTIEKGIVKISSMDMDGQTAFLGTTGSVDLPKWWIDTDHTVTLKNNEEVPPFEMSFNGSLDDPKHTFAEGPLNNYLSKKINRKLEKLLSDKLGKNLGGSGGALSDALGDKLGNQLGGALGGFLGGGSGSSQRAPANDNVPQQQPAGQQQQQEIQPEEAIEGLLKGLLGR